MLKTTSKEFKERVKRFIVPLLPMEREKEYFTDGERALCWKNSVIKQYGAFTPATVKERILCGGSFFFGSLEMVEILAGFFGKYAEERQAYYYKWTREFFRTEDDGYILDYYALTIYKGVENLCKGVESIPEFSILSGVLGLIEERKEGRGAYPWREYVYIIVDGVKVAGYSLKGVHVPPAYRDLQAQRVKLIFKNGLPYRLEKEA